MGKRIEKFRKQRGLTIDELAKAAQLDADTLRSIEADESVPPIASLIKLAKALAINVADIFRERPPSKPFEILRANKRQAFAHGSDEAGHSEFGYDYQLLMEPSDDKHLQAFWIEILPMKSVEKVKSVRHPGEEFVLVLEGELSGEVGTDHFSLKAGDSLYIHSDHPHRLYNLGSVTVKAVTVVYPF